MKKMNIITVGLIKGRHEMPVENYIFNDAIENVHDYEKINSHIKNFLHSNMTITINDGIAINSYGETEIFEGDKHLVVYVTGLTAVTAELIKVCALNGVKLTLMHFNNATGEYVPQYIF